MTAREAYKMIQWYNVYYGEVYGDNEDYAIYCSLIDSLKDCHDMIEESGMTYHQYYHYCNSLQAIDQEELLEREYDSDFDE